MFDKELYDKYDTPSKQVLMNILSHRGYTLQGDINEEHYKDTDIITKDDKGNEVKWEIQVRSQDNYNKLRDNTYKTFFVHTRKNQNTSQYYVVFPEDYKEMAIISMKHIKESPIKTVKTKRGEYESFFDVPMKYVNFYSVSDNFQITNCKIPN
jgi:hypothetical protein